MPGVQRVKSAEVQRFAWDQPPRHRSVHVPRQALCEETAAPENEALGRWLMLVGYGDRWSKFMVVNDG